jgi:hypothetical protein
LVWHENREALTPVDPCHPVERKMPMVVQQCVRFREAFPLGQKYTLSRFETDAVVQPSDRVAVQVK